MKCFINLNFYILFCCVHYNYTKTKLHPLVLLLIFNVLDDTKVANRLLNFVHGHAIKYCANLIHKVSSSQVSRSFPIELVPISLIICMFFPLSFQNNFTNFLSIKLDCLLHPRNSFYNLIIWTLDYVIMFYSWHS